MQQTEFNAARSSLLPPSAAAPVNRFDIFGPGDVGREALEALIFTGYGTHFGARIRGFMPRLARYRHADGASAVIGVRKGSEGPLFLESYLPGPMDGIIGSLTGSPVDRARVAEVGQFVVGDRRIVPDFFRDLVSFLIEDGCEWVCFTGTHRVRAILKRIGFRGLPVGVADANLVPPGNDAWGDYYENEPVVILGRLEDPEGHWCRRFDTRDAGVDLDHLS